MAITIVVTGAMGRMGRETINRILSEPDLELVGAVDRISVGERLANVIPGIASDLTVDSDLDDLITRRRPQVLVDFTTPADAGRNALTAASRSVRPVVGATGLAPDEIEAITAECKRHRIGGAIIPNFSIGAMLLRDFAIAATKHYQSCEIIELHHDRKLDAPSGTANSLRTELEQSIDRTVPVHSVRLPGLLAHHHIIFGAPGENLTIIHDSTDRQSFMPGLVLAIRKVTATTRFFRSLRELLD